MVFTAAPITLPSNGEPQTDIAIVLPPESRYDERHPGPEDIYWLIEVSNSTLAFDLEEKAPLYARDSSAEYWVVEHVPNHQLWVDRQPEAGIYREVLILASGGVIPLAFPDLEVKVERLLLGR